MAVLKETAQGDRRVSITPRAATTLVANDFEVVIEAGAGELAGFSDEDYVRAGAAIAETKDVLYDDATVVTWVKPPARPEGELSRMPKGATVIGFMNPFGKKSVLPLLDKWGLRKLCLEQLPLRRALPPSMDALAMMSRFAGRIALEEAISIREKSGDEGPYTVLVLGAGHAGMAAARTASKKGCKLVCASPGGSRRSEIEAELGGTFVKLPDDRTAKGPETALLEAQKAVREILAAHRPSILVTTARRRERAPKLVLKGDLALLRKNSVVVDLTTAAGGNVEGGVADEAVRTPNGVWLCNRSNYPSADPLKSSSAFSLCLTEILIARLFLKQ